MFVLINYLHFYVLNFFVFRVHIQNVYLDNRNYDVYPRSLENGINKKKALNDLFYCSESISIVVKCSIYSFAVQFQARSNE